VLGEGRLLLDDGIEAALARHRIGEGEASVGVAAARRVATFIGERGQALTLYEVPPETPPIRGLAPASLDELVLGRLASGRPGSAAPSLAA
ncbi:MAG: hypothetical protein ACRDGL_06385, partial [Candidatus Limnocylindrales bacterium]